MIIQQIRNATLKIKYGGISFLLDPWLQDQGTGFSVKTVRPEFQGQGFMRKILDDVYKVAGKKNIPVILNTDDKDKAARYEHLGMKLERIRNCGENEPDYGIHEKRKKMMSVQMESCTIEKNGFNAFYYPGNLADDMAIISVGGASCDEKTSIAMSGFLRKAGYNVLVLGFYMWKGMSKNLVSIPIDYVEKAVDWLKDEKGIKKIVMTGASTGAGYTLACASLIKEIGCVIPIVPFDYNGRDNFKF